MGGGLDVGGAWSQGGRSLVLRGEAYVWAGPGVKAGPGVWAGFGCGRGLIVGGRGLVRGGAWCGRGLE